MPDSNKLLPSPRLSIFFKLECCFLNSSQKSFFTEKREIITKSQKMECYLIKILVSCLLVKNHSADKMFGGQNGPLILLTDILLTNIWLTEICPTEI
jgi:hypothetical protein